MEIQISDTRTILDVQSEFNREFPFLKIEFLGIPHNSGVPSLKSHVYNSDRKLSQCRKLHNEGKLKVDGNRSVGNLEKELWEKFGLSALIFRKSGKLWIETSLTESWTLQKQNAEGMEWSRHINGQPGGDTATL
jgi:hypothetical protein